MREIANDLGLECYNKLRSKYREIMEVDHVLISDQNMYNCFPFIVVEHENNDLGTADGTPPHMECSRAYIEWAFWKAIALRAKLSVVVSYPWERDKQKAKDVFRAMAQGYQDHFGDIPNC